MGHKATTFGMKRKTRIGFWNVRTMKERGKLKQVVAEMKKYKLDILGLSEVRWPEYGEVTTSDGVTLLYSGETGQEAEHRSGVGILLTKEAKKSLIEWEPISDRIIIASFETNVRNVSIIQCYAPTETSEMDRKENFYRTLREIKRKLPRRNLILVMGDLNAKIGTNNEGLEHIMGTHGIGQANENGEMFKTFCSEHDLAIGGSMFIHKNCHKVSWVSPDHVTENQIDHMAISRKFRRSLLNVRNRRGADVGSDHHLMVAEFKMKILSAPSKWQRRSRRLNVGKLKLEHFNEEYKLKLQNRFEVLTNLEEEEINNHWIKLKEVFLKVGEEVMGFRNPLRREWMSDATWKEIGNRRQLKEKINQSKTRQQKAILAQQYKEANTKVKRSARRDQRIWVDEQAAKAEEAARKGDVKELYGITRSLAMKGFRRNRPIKDKEGNVITSTEEQMRRWEEHFHEVLNKETENPEEPEFRLPEVEEDIRIDIALPSRLEIKEGLKEMKNNKAPGLDNVTAELLKADIETTALMLEPLFAKIWEQERIPTEWRNGLIVKIPKKGDIADCNNWRGITLLPVVSKVLNKVILKRIKGAIELRLRKEQAGFRVNRSCTDLINTLRIILEQCAEWQSPLYMAFIDFEKAFDSVNRDIMWKILKKYGVPEKIINLIKVGYEEFECQVIHEGKLSNPICIDTGVKQGCILSPTLFIVILDAILRGSLAGRRRGIQWNLRDRLEDLDFADDVCILAQRFNDLQEKLSALNRIASRVGLKINVNKTKEMRTNERIQDPLVLEGRVVERVNSFVYLGSVVTADGGAEDDVKSRIKKANGAFVQLYPLWKNRNISRKTKLRIFNTNVKSVMLYGCETWKPTMAVTRPLQVFINRCLRRIVNIWWPEIISNQELYRLTNQVPIHNEIRKRKWRWIGHTLRKPDYALEKEALEWTPQGVRKRGRPRESWRRGVEREARQVGRNWREVKRAAADRDQWRTLVEALCPSGS